MYCRGMPWTLWIANVGRGGEFLALSMSKRLESNLCALFSLREAKPGGFPLFSGKVQIVSRTLSGLFLVGALNRPRKRKGANRENPRTIPEQIGKSGKSQRTKKEGPVQIGKPPPFETPCLAALDFTPFTFWNSRILFP